MMDQLRNLTYRALASLGGAVAAMASRFAPRTPAPNPPPPPHQNGADPNTYPEFSGSPEAAAILWQLPPAAILKTRVLTSIKPNGEIPDSCEAIRLTAIGKVIMRSDYILTDSFGVIGRAEQLPGRCDFCGRISFHAAVCHRCKRVACAACGGDQVKVDGRPEYRCREHLKEAKWAEDLWVKAAEEIRELRASHES